MIYAKETLRTELKWKAVELEMKDGTSLGTIWGYIQPQDKFDRQNNHITILDDKNNVAASLWNCQVIK
jgi:hypothetical protein